MFGYISVNKAVMKFKEFDIYHSYYCGLCHALKERYGAAGQLTLSYDMTFILMLLTSLYEPEGSYDTGKCIAHPFEKHEIRRNIYTDYVADMNIILSYYKCQDDWEDDRKFHKMLFGKLLEGKALKHREYYLDKVRKINMLMHEIRQKEKENCQDVDIMAGLFGQIMAEITAAREDEWKDNLRNLGFYLGKFIYLLDAYDDVEEDIKRKRYNPLMDHFRQPEFEENCHTILMLMMAECCKEFEKLPLLENVEILRNILYSGVWCRYEVVREKRRENIGNNNSGKGTVNINE